MDLKKSVSFTIFIPIRQRDGESSHFYLYYCGPESDLSRSRDAFEKKHLANGDLEGRLTVFTRPKDGREPAKHVWQLKERMADAFWVREILTGLASTRRAALKEFLAQCLRDARRNPQTPFRTVFSASAGFYDS